MAKTANDERVVPGHPALDGTGSVHRTSLTSPNVTGPVVLPYDKRPVIPILFIPGVMGTRLYSTKQHKVVWDPPNGFWEGLGAAYTYHGKNTQDRVTELDATQTVVAGSVPGNIDSLNGLNQARKGWNALYSSSYFPFMEYLEKTLDIRGTGLHMPPEFYVNPKEYGALSGAALTDSEYRFALGEYRYEVWGGGYNWLQSNRDSADKLWPIIQKILAYYEKRKILNKAGKLIIVSHSMGGLVTRSLCSHPERAAKILGVLSLAQPTAGAPAAYKRIRAGFEGAESIVLGRNAADVTGILGRCDSGGLEVLPFASYNQKQPWLMLEEAKIGMPNLPSSGDPFKDIYKSTHPLYALVPDQNLKYLPWNDTPTPAARRKKFLQTIEAVKTFQESIANFPNLNKLQTKPLYAAWGAGTGGKASTTWRRLYWSKEYSPPAEQLWRSAKNAISSKPVLKDDGTGTVTIGKLSYSLEMEQCAGDGTVPEVSGQEVQHAAQVSFAHGNKKGRNNQKGTWEHQNCCLDPRIQWVTIYSLVKIVNAFASTELKP